MQKQEYRFTITEALHVTFCFLNFNIYIFHCDWVLHLSFFFNIEALYALSICHCFHYDWGSELHFLFQLLFF